VVCHEDDIQLIFNNYANGVKPNAAQAKVSKELQARYASFAKIGNPNPTKGAFLQWNQVGVGESLNLLVIGNDNESGISKMEQSQKAGTCGGNGKGLWGDQVQFDWQFYSA